MPPLSSEVLRLIERRMASGNYLSENALLLEALQALEFDDADLLAIQEGVNAVDEGDPGVPLDHAFDRLLAKNLVQD